MENETLDKKMTEEQAIEITRIVNLINKQLEGTEYNMAMTVLILHACGTEPYTVIFSAFLTALHQIGKNFTEDKLSFALDEMKKEIINARREEGIV